MNGGRALGRCLAEISVLELRMMRADPSIDVALSYKDVLYLNIIAGEGSVTASRLAELACVTKPTVTARIKGLEARGYVVRERSPDDGRVFNIRLSEGMADAYKREWDIMDSIMDGIESRHGERRAGEFLEILGELSDGMHGYVPEAPHDTDRRH